MTMSFVALIFAAMSRNDWVIIFTLNIINLVND